MNENQKNYKKKNNKRFLTGKLYKITNDEDFFKSSSEEVSDSVSFQNQIKHSENNNKSSKNKNNLLINKKLKEKIINSKGSTSSSNKIKIAYDTKEEIKQNINNDNNFNNNNDQKKLMLFEETENIDSKEDENKEEILVNNENNSKKIQFTYSIYDSKKDLLSSNNNNLSDNKINNDNDNKHNNIIDIKDDNKDDIKDDNKGDNKDDNKNDNTDDNKDNNEEEEDINKIINNYVDSSYNSSKKKDLHSINSNKLNSESNSNFQNKEENSECSKENENDINNNKQTIINLKPLNIKVRNKNPKNENNLSNTKKITTMFTSSEIHNLKNDNSKKSQRKAIKRISQREYSINSSNSSNKDTEIDENKIKRFVTKYFLNLPILIIMIIINIFSLFSNDIKHIWLKKDVDIYFDIIYFIALFFFILEIIALSILKETYLNSSDFWMDLIGTLFIIFNIELITDYIFRYNKINNISSIKLNNSIDYLNICIIMIERVVRIFKTLKYLNLFNLIETVKKLRKIYSEKLEREANQKNKLIQKIQDIEEENEEGIEESILSNESLSRSKNNFFIESEKKEIEEKEENDKFQFIKRREKRTPSFICISAKEENKNENNNKIKSSITTRKLNKAHTSKKINNRTFSRKGSLKSVKQNIIHNKYSLAETDKLNNDKKDKEAEEKNKMIKNMEEEIYKKIDENLKNVKITSKVKNSIRKKIIIIFTILLLICILLNEDLFPIFKSNDKIMLYSYFFELIINCPFKENNICEDKINTFLSMEKENEYPIINITKNDILIYENINITKSNNYRYCELGWISSKNMNNNNTEIIVNIYYLQKRENNIRHILYLILTIIVCFTIILATSLMETDLTNILLTPIEVMIEVADKVAKDPINAKNIEELEQGVIDILKRNKNTNFKQKNFFNEKNKYYDERYNSYEVKAVMNAIIKISALLAMSVGEAGGEIIHKNLSFQLGIHLHSRGKKKIAIFGFCNIRNFEEINLVLQEETIPLINKIAEIVHSSVDRFRGNTNKNIGDSFLNVWKFYNNINITNNHNKTIKKDNLLEIDPSNPQVNITADCAVLAYLRVILKINKNLNILEYRKNKKLNKIIPNFKINMGFGLHLGYGIEGPVGSIFKMEASYLSPNVNIAARLETATKQFGVNLLISGKLYDLLTDEMKGICRYVDCVTVKGSTEPIDLYTIDINENITPQKEKLKIVKTSEEKAKIFKEKKAMLEYLIEEYGSITPLILEKKSYWELIDEKSDKFYDSWEYAMDSYKRGMWDEAKKYFEECLEEDSKDGPSNTLYNYIKKFNYKSPKNWKGERELTNK